MENGGERKGEILTEGNRKKGGEEGKEKGSARKRKGEKENK